MNVAGPIFVGSILMSISMILAIGNLLDNDSLGLHRPQKWAHNVDDLSLGGEELIAVGEIKVEEEREIRRSQSSAYFADRRSGQGAGWRRRAFELQGDYQAACCILDDPPDFHVGRSTLHSLPGQRKSILLCHLRNRLIVSRNLSHSALLCQLALRHHSGIHRRPHPKEKLRAYWLLLLLYCHLSLHDGHVIDWSHEGELFCQVGSFVFARNLHRHLLCYHSPHCSNVDQPKIARNWIWNNGNAPKSGSWYLPSVGRCAEINARRIAPFSRIPPSNIFLFSHQLPVRGNVHSSQGHRPDQRQQVGRKRLQEAVLEENFEVGPGRKSMISVSLYVFTLTPIVCSIFIETATFIIIFISLLPAW